MIGGIIGLFLILFVGTIVLLLFAFWIWMLIDAIQNKGLTDGEKIGWVLAIVFLHIIGAILYFIIGSVASLVGGTMLGGAALGGVSFCRRTATTAKMTSPTTSATDAAAINARVRWRLRRELRRELTAMVSC